MQDKDINAAIAFAQAAKKSIDYRKHAQEITLPVDLINRLRKDFQHCVSNWD
jgi:hypothetical protein